MIKNAKKSSNYRSLTKDCTSDNSNTNCVCTALQLGGDVEQPWHMSKYDVIRKPEVHNVSLRR